MLRLGTCSSWNRLHSRRRLVSETLCQARVLPLRAAISTYEPSFFIDKSFIDKSSFADESPAIRSVSSLAIGFSFTTGLPSAMGARVVSTFRTTLSPSGFRFKALSVRIHTDGRFVAVTDSSVAGSRRVRKQTRPAHSYFTFESTLSVRAHRSRSSSMRGWAHPRTFDVAA